MKGIDITRPDKLLLKGIKTLGALGQNLYSDKKSEAKAKAELTFIGKKKMESVQSQLYQFDAKAYTVENDLDDFSFLKEAQGSNISWLNFHGVHDVELLKKVGKAIHLDRLTIRQILDTTQRPKVDEYDDHLFFSVKSIAKNKEEIDVEQLSFVLGSHYAVSFQEEIGDHFDGIRNKLKEGLGFVRKRSSDYLLSQLLDAILDNYFETIDQTNEAISLIEKVVIDDPDKSTLIVLEKHKQNAQTIKKALGPFKEALTNLMNGDSKLIQQTNLKYFRDLGNSASAAMEEIESTLRTLEGLTNICFASQSQKMNETMKVLTTVATIFIPLTFIAGIYGMNFDNMPELHNPNGYFYTWGVMGAIFIAMLIYFKVKKWI
ncbi:magnesium transporter [Reichenbachiella faecimaris]|uniref:Magnesium transport protein CorA n=1 Tax=Reichenbachiella faecimaris TaxID=692418 RepID=A0A1W2GBC0_REIFA|nr:magnesium/cobalt transporter CorA [Reichenbachiella faecimaris]SMD33923.1 magnesium transporter [Reichenbachiella faecimaris]